jgi:retinol dehydrogenase-14
MPPPDSPTTCLVTGATSGIGQATALRLAQQGLTVVLVGRDREKADRVVRQIKTESNNERIDALIADLASQQAVRALAAAFKAAYPRLDVLINNAGAIFTKRSLTEDGIERTFAVNYLARFLLTHLLLDVLIASAPARIVNVAGAYHARGDLFLDDVTLERRYDYATANNRAKLADVLFTHELARRLSATDVTVNCLHPGAVRTDALLKDRDASFGLKLMYRLGRLFFKSPAKGAETPVYLATAPDLEAVTGEYFVDKKRRQSAPKTYDLALQRQLWDLSIELTNLRQEETPVRLD